MSFPAGSGAVRGGWGYPPVLTENLMKDPRPQPTLREQFAMGAGKAHRQINYSHHDYRNFSRDHLARTGIVSPVR